MDIDGLGPAVVEKLLERKLIKDVADIYYLKYNDIYSLENFKDKSTRNLLAAIEESKKKPLSRLLFAMGIRFIGSHTAEILACEFGDLDTLAGADFGDIEKIREIGPKIAESVVTFFKQQQNLDIIRRLREAGVNFKAGKQVVEARESFAGKTFVLTGKLEGFSREKAREIIENFGGRVASSVSRRTDAVLAGEDLGSKLDQAKKLNVSIISEDDFVEMIK